MLAIIIFAVILFIYFSIMFFMLCEEKNNYFNKVRWPVPDFLKGIVKFIEPPNYRQSKYKDEWFKIDE